MRKKLKYLFGVLLLILTACSSTTNTNEAGPLGAGEYAAILPYETSDSRIKHASLISDTATRVLIEEGLMDLSKTYFLPSQVAYKTQEFLTYDELDSTDGSRGLLGTYRDDNPNGLNPGSDEEFDTGNGTVTGAVVLVDLYELDWYADDELQGISIAMIVNDSLDDANGNTLEITDERLKNYMEVTSGRMVSYMRERFNAITTNVPIYVAYFTLDSSDDALASCIYQGYFEGSQGEYSDVDLKWMNIPSTTFTNEQATMAGQFSDYRSTLSVVLADYSYVVGQATIQNGEVTQLHITITCNGKSAGEILAVTQAASEELSTFTDTTCTYKVKIDVDEQTYAMVEREYGSTNSTVMTFS